MKTIGKNFLPLSPVAGVITAEDVAAQVAATLSEEERINASLERSLDALALQGDFNAFSDCFKDRYGWRPDAEMMAMRAAYARGENYFEALVCA